MVDEVKPPAGIGAAGRQLWRQIARAAAQDDLEMTATEHRWLWSAAKLTDRLAAIEAAMEGGPMIVPGYNGQPVAQPLLTEARQYHLLISQTLARLKLDVPDDAGVFGVAGANKARTAANARWRPGGRS